MRVRHITYALVTLFLVSFLCASASGDSPPKKAINAVPNLVYKYFNAMGSRVKASGKEKTTYIGEFFDKSGKSFKARVIHQLPGLVRLEGFKIGGGHLSFDGERSYGIASKNKDEALLEAFLVDFPEGMIESVQNGAAVRIIGRGFGPDLKVEPHYTGIRYDIYEVAGPIRCREDKLLRSKRYYFDSLTGLLQKTFYRDRSASSPIEIETQFSEWVSIEGSAYPARIDQYVNGSLEFTFIAESIKGEASSDKGIFK